MNRIRKRIFIGVVIIIGSIYLSGCGKIFEMSVGTIPTEETIETPVSEVRRYEITAQDHDTLTGQAVEIDLSNPADSPDELYTYEDRILTIRMPGNYRLSGTWEEGSIHVNLFADETVHLFFNNVEINSREGAAVHVENAAKVVITVEEGTQNTLSANFRQAGVRQACIFSNVDLTVNGSGALSVYCYQADGVRSKDQLKIVNANLYVKAKEDGLRGNDGVILHHSVVTVECEGTGILSNSDKDMVVLREGNIKVVAGINAISARQYVSVRDSQVDLYSVLETVHCEGIRELDEELGP